MNLFPREVGDWEDENAHFKAWAHGMLDLMKAGEPMELEVIRECLRFTGDSVGLDVDAVMRGS